MVWQMPDAESEICCSAETELLCIYAEQIDGPLGVHGALSDAFRCPMSLTYMREPTLAADGHTYERAYLVRLFNTTATPRSPVTNAPLRSKQMQPNHSLKKAFQSWTWVESGLPIGQRTERTLRNVTCTPLSPLSPLCRIRGAQPSEARERCRRVAHRAANLAVRLRRHERNAVWHWRGVQFTEWRTRGGLVRTIAPSIGVHVPAMVNID